MGQLLNAQSDLCVMPMQQNNVAWAYDVDHLYGPVQPVNYNTEQQPAFRGGNTSEVVLNQNQHFVVWMRPAAQPTFRKLWAVIDVPLLAGDCHLITPRDSLWVPDLVPSMPTWLLTFRTLLH